MRLSRVEHEFESRTEYHITKEIKMITINKQRDNLYTVDYKTRTIAEIFPAESGEFYLWFAEETVGLFPERFFTLVSEKLKELNAEVAQLVER
jgi:hypothetical protein